MYNNHTTPTTRKHRCRWIEVFWYFCIGNNNTSIFFLVESSRRFSNKNKRFRSALVVVDGDDDVMGCSEEYSPHLKLVSDVCESLHPKLTTSVCERECFGFAWNDYDRVQSEHSANRSWEREGGLCVCMCMWLDGQMERTKKHYCWCWCPTVWRLTERRASNSLRALLFTILRAFSLSEKRSIAASTHEGELGESDKLCRRQRLVWRPKIHPSFSQHTDSTVSTLTSGRVH